ncbi:hypothetical protein COCON_G00078000 [Conger conger]|uniref:Uncharacterized protein n=1 Tax=Conger conger TaxID=82655 RepID=A0A9Q1DP24_CONCO|nr:hypothetical protein COCON_G00078000 [Conger conger]
MMQTKQVPETGRKRTCQKRVWQPNSWRASGFLFTSSLTHSVPRNQSKQWGEAHPEHHQCVGPI